MCIKCDIHCRKDSAEEKGNGQLYLGRKKNSLFYSPGILDIPLKEYYVQLKYVSLN